MKSQSALQFAFAHLKPHRWSMASAVFWRTLFELVPMQVPVLTGAIIDGLNGERVNLYGLIHLPGSPASLLGAAAIGLLILALAYGASSYFRTTATAKLSRKFISGLRKALLVKLETLSLDVHNKFGAGELLNRVILDTQSMRRFIESGFARSFTNLVMIGYPLTMMLIMDWRLAMVAFSILPLQLIAVRALQSRLHHALRSARKTQSHLTTAVKESLDGIETIQAVNAGEDFTNKLSAQAESLESDQLRSNRYTAMISSSVWGLTSLGYALTWWQGGLRVMEGRMTLGALVAFTSFAAFLYTPFRRFTNIVNIYRRGLVGLERIQEIFALSSSVEDSPDARPLQLREGKIELREVAFGYGQRQVLASVNLEIMPRQLTVVMGKSGSGKSSLLGLLARLHDPTAGCVLFDGQDLRNVTLQSLRSQIAVVPQRAFIFSDTIAGNIRIAKPEASDAEIEQACRDAEAWEFIHRLPQGLETKLGQGGANLSGGEAQRIAIARALIRKPRILLLDEPTSALDTATEAAIVATLTHLKRRMTIVLIGHHPQAMRGADRVVTVSEEKVTASSDRKMALTAAA